MSDTTAKMAALLRTLRTQTNGAVVEAMSARGADYPLSYGVSVADIRRIASPYAPDEPLARLCYRQQVRELRLAALYIADPAQVTPADIAFWGAGIDSPETAEHVALMLGRSPAAWEIMMQWLAGDSPLLHYTALMCGSKAVAEGAASAWDYAELVGSMSRAAANGDLFSDRGTTVLAGRLWRREPVSHPALLAFVEGLRDTRPLLWEALREEMI